MYNEFSKVYDNMMSYVDYELWIELIERYLDEFDVESVLELGCGTGEVTLRLYRDGYKVLGTDISETMLIHARRKAELYEYDINFEEKNMIEIESEEKYDSVISIFDTINHLKSTEELSKVFGNVNKILNDKGVFLFDVVSREMLEEMFVDGIFADDREDMTILWEHYYDEETQLDNITTSFFVRTEGNMYERIDEHHEKMIFTRKEIVEAAKKNNFSLHRVEENDQIAGARSVYVFRKGYDEVK